MPILLTIIIFCVGAMLGSFLGVALDRYNTGRSMGGRSICFTCNKKLGPHELIPVLSYMMQGGKCRGCKSKVSFEYVLIELVAGLTAVLIFFKFWGAYTMYSPFDFFLMIALYTLIFSFLIVIVFYDIRHLVIPDGFVFAFIGFSFFGMFFLRDVNLFQDILAGIAICAPFAFIWAISGGKWMGFGDVKLALGMGWLLGLSAGVAALMLSFWIGAIIGILLMVFKGHKYMMKTELPFGPFLVLGTYIVFFASLDLNSIMNIFS